MIASKIKAETNRGPGHAYMGRAGVAAGVSMLLLLTTALPANAAEGTATVPSVQPQPTAAQVESFANTMLDEHTSWSELSPDAVQSLRETYETTDATSNSGLEFSVDSSSGWKAADDMNILRIPAVEGQGVVDQTSITVMFDNNGAIIGSAEFELIPVSADSGTIRVWSDKQLVTDQLVSAPADGSVTASPTARSADGSVSTNAYHKGDWWGNLNTCLSNAGIAAWTIAAISLACGGICLASVGTLCVVCIGAAAAGIRGTVDYCIQVANNNS